MQKIRSALLSPLLTLSVLISLGAQIHAAEEQIVIEDLTPRQLREQIKRIETEFYRVFNDSVEDENEELIINCFQFIPTGSNIKEETCEPQFLTDTRGRNVNDARFGADVLLSPQDLRQRLGAEYKALTAAMTKLNTESEYFRELNSILAALRDELENR